MSTTATHPGSARDETRDPLDVALWIAQIALFTVFAATGLAKLTMSIDRLAPMMAWVTDAPLALVRFIGVAELAGALGVLLPAVTRVHPELTPLAALGLTVVMVLGTAVNFSTGELTHTPVSIVLGALAAFVAWGRYRLAPISPRRSSQGSG
jgi:hypothetical protein